MNRIVFVMAAAELAACGQGRTVLPPLEQSSCKMTFSGAVTGTFACGFPPSLFWDSDTNTAHLGIALRAAGTTPDVSVAIGFRGNPQAGSYPSTEPGVDGGITVFTGSDLSTQHWNARGGSYTLVLTDAADAGSVDVYNPQRTVDAVLRSTTGTTVTLHVTF